MRVLFGFERITVLSAFSMERSHVQAGERNDFLTAGRERADMESGQGRTKSVGIISIEGGAKPLAI
jgi:hypothetical protein